MKVTDLLAQLAFIGAFAYLLRKLQVAVQVGYNTSDDAERKTDAIGFQVITADDDDDEE
jgi:hypothetical protein